MPVAIKWTEAQQGLLVSLTIVQRVPARMVATRLGVSRSFLQRKLARYASEQEELRQLEVASARRIAGTAPLPPGHELSWRAISTQAYEPAP